MMPNMTPFIKDGVIHIEGYLTQSKLEKVLKLALGEENFLARESPVKRVFKDCPLPANCKWDMIFNINRHPTAVEFDGDSHYRDSLVMRRDEYKEIEAAKSELFVIRIPYWVQLTNETFKYYFHTETNIEQSFPHGFITTKVFPASFCALGIQRFEEELRHLPESVFLDVLGSLIDKRLIYGNRYVTEGLSKGLEKNMQLLRRETINSWITVEEFIRRGEEVHGKGTYDYSAVKGNELPSIVVHEKKRLGEFSETKRGWLYLGEIEHAVR